MNLKVVASIGMSVLTISGIVAYDLVIRDRALSTEVVVAKDKIEQHTVFDMSNLVVERRNKNQLVEGYVTPDEINTILGKDAAVAVLKNQMISTEFVDFINLTPDPKKNEAIRPIPSEWIYALPGSLRRKDVISIYAVKDKDKETTSSQSIRVVDRPQEIESDKEEILTAEDVESKSPEEVASQFTPIMSNIAVVYVKTSSNQEVMNKEDSEERLNASGTAAELEVNITEEQLEILMNYIENGYKFYISYR